MRNLTCLLILTACRSSLHAQNRVQEAWVRHYSSGLVPGAEYATAIAVDKSGNVYVTGYSPNVPFGYDYVTIKYNSSGAKLWIAKYNGPGNGDDQPVAIAVDASGNVYVTGSSYVSKTDVDFVTVKYNTNGVQQWVARYESAGNLLDNPSALVIDSNGNVYVTGMSRSAVLPEAGDYVTVKYNSNGNEQWVRTYNGPNNRSDGAVAIAIDAAGNVYVAGASRYGNPGSSTSDYATIKYNSAGAQQWIARYHGSSVNGYGEPIGLAVDVAGNVYVTGTLGNVPYTNYATVKYNSAGVQQWDASYHAIVEEAATALAIDQLGNVYVTGRSGPSGGTYDYATVKYNAAGMQQWVARYTGPVGDSDRATDIAVDAGGNVYVTGVAGQSACTTVKYNSAGIEQWIARYSGKRIGALDPMAALTIDNAGNVYVAGSSLGVGQDNPDYVTIKYDNSGAEKWVARYDESRSSFDRASALTVDAAGNIYITGFSKDSTGSFDYATIKYTASGEKQWLARYDGEGRAIVLDLAGNVCVTGGTYFEYITLKYNARGEQLWAARYNGSENGVDYATALAVDKKGNVYVTGKSEVQVSGYDYVTIKYNSLGIEQWIARYSYYLSGTNSAEGPNLVVDATGNVYVTGKTATIKYNSAGQKKWAVHDIFANAIAVDAIGNVYVAGSTEQNYTAKSNYVTIKYDSTGKKQWEMRYDGGLSYSVASALTIDQFGNVYVTGKSVSQTSNDYATIKYNSFGVAQWVARYNGPANGEDEAIAIAVDKPGNVYVAGTSASVNDANDYATVKYSPVGVEQWVARYRGPAGSNDFAADIGIDIESNIYVAGWSLNQNGGYWAAYTTVKYIQNPVAVEEQQNSQSTTYWLGQNHPNPFNPSNPSTTIRYALAKPGYVTLKVFNLQGQEMATLVNANKSAGEYQIQWHPTDAPSGVYVYRLQAGEFVETKKLILLQ